MATTRRRRHRLSSPDGDWCPARSHHQDAAEVPSCFSPRATMSSEASGKGRCSERASSVGAFIQVSISSDVDQVVRPAVQRHQEQALPRSRCSRAALGSGDDHIDGSSFLPGYHSPPCPNRCYPCCRSASPSIGSPSSMTASLLPFTLALGRLHVLTAGAFLAVCIAGISAISVT